MTPYEKLLSTGLTTTHAESAALVMKGLSNAEIAKIRNLSAKTVKWHLNTTFAHLGVKNRSQLILWIVNNP